MEKNTKKQENPRTDKHFPFASLIFVWSNRWTHL